MPASPKLDWALASYSYRAAQDDPQSALSWAESINNQRIRARMTEQVAANWKLQDPKGFQEYLDRNDFSTEEKTRLSNAVVWSRGHPGSD